MSLDGKILKRALDDLKADKDKRAAMFARRRAEVYELIPRIKQIDTSLRISALEAVGSAFAGLDNAEAEINKIARKSLALQSESVELLVSRGFPVDYLDETFLCSKCSDSGFAGSSPCECLLRYYKKEQIKELSSLLKLGSETFETFSLSWYSKEFDPQIKDSPYNRMEAIFNFCKGYAETFDENSGNVFMNGPTGLGKTFLCTCIAKVVSEKGFSVVYDTAVNVFSNFEQEHFSHEESDEAGREIRRYLNCDLFILDDLGTEMATSFTTSTLYSIINGRLNSGKKTIINSNLDLTALENRYSPQIVSRLCGDYMQLSFAGKDIRLQKRGL